jgi:hypothetical protein
MSVAYTYRMNLTAMQPGYLPWPGYFERIRMADVYVMSDDVPMDGGGVVNRNRVKVNNEQGWTWLTVPVYKEDVPIKDVRICNDTPWQRKHQRTLEQTYGELPMFWRWLYSGPWTELAPLLQYTFVWFCGELGITTPVVRASRLEVPGHKTERLVNLCKHFGADAYLSGSAGRDYLELARFSGAGIQVTFHDYEPTPPGLSMLDVILSR